MVISTIKQFIYDKLAEICHNNSSVIKCAALNCAIFLLEWSSLKSNFQDGLELILASLINHTFALKQCNKMLDSIDSSHAPLPFGERWSSRGLWSNAIVGTRIWSIPWNRNTSPPGPTADYKSRQVSFNTNPTVHRIHKQDSTKLITQASVRQKDAVTFNVPAISSQVKSVAPPAVQERGGWLQAAAS